ncbi:trypsin-like peptidase domain-containing protein [Clostridium sp. JNZ J1-5]
MVIRTRHSLAIFIFLSIIIFMPSYLAQAIDIKDNQIVDKNKTWTIKFNKEVQLDSLTKENILVTDTSNNKINVELKLGGDNKSVIVNPPANGYEAGKKYTLKIGNKMQSKDNKSLKEEIIFNYSIKEDANKELTTKEIVSKYGKAVVYVEIEDKNHIPIGTGSGFIVNSNGTVVTNFHVIKGAAYGKVTMQDGTKYEMESVLNYNEKQDIAILKLKNTSNLPVVILGDSDKVELADDVIAIGSPEGYSNTISPGIISGLNRTGSRGYKDIQTTASITHGSSGGALFNKLGQVVGITYAGFESSGDLGFVIPINEVKLFLSNFNPKSLSDVNGISSSSTKPQAPTGVKAWTASNNEIRLQWSQVSNIDGYYVYISYDGVKWEKVVDDYTSESLFQWNTEYSLHTQYLYPETTIYYKVTSVKNEIESTPSSVVSAKTYVTYFPLMNTLPELYGEYEDYTIDDQGYSVLYYYLIEDLPESFMEDYDYILSKYGWEYYNLTYLDNGTEVLWYHKNGQVASITTLEGYVIIGGTVH